MIDTKTLEMGLKESLPRVTGTVNLTGLDGAVQVYRDQYGIPHIHACSRKDAFFAQGFVTAQDRLWHMEFDRKRGAGRWAEVVGESAVEQDKLMRRFRLEDSAKADYQASSAETRAMLDAYASGVNAFVDTSDSLPIEYQITELEPETWQPWHGLVAYKVRHILMGVFESKVWRAQVVAKLGPEKASQLFPGFQPGYPVILPPGEAYAGQLAHGLEELRQGAAALNYLYETDAGSNSWVLSGSRTGTGKPILAGDSHRALDTPNVYYQNQIACPDFDAVGLSFPGVPGFPHFGHNASVAWSVTHASADYQDLYIERFKTVSNGSGSPEYLFKDQWLPAAVHDETIKVNGAKDVDIQSIVTQHGPVISGDPSKGCGLSFKYTATEGPSSWPNTLFAMLEAEDAPQLIESMREWMDPCNNFLYADIHGNSGYLCRGRIPIRPGEMGGINGWLPVPGWTGEHEWQGYIPFDELPSSLNPEQGYVVTANNRPVGDDYPHYISTEFTPGFRAKRVAHRLLGIDKPGVEDMASVHSERVSIPAVAYAKFLRRVEPQDSLSAQARDKLIAWDGQMDAGNIEPAIYSVFRDALLREVLEQNLGRELAAVAWNPGGRGLGGFLARFKAHLINLIDRDDRGLLASGDDWQALMSRALASGVRQLKETLGDDMESWRWDRLHQARPKHTLSAAYPEHAGLLDPPPIPTSGDGDTPLAGSYSLSDPATVTGLSVVRYAFDTSDWSKSLWAVPLGSSGHPGSHHYHDQSDTWRKVKMVPMQYDWDHIAAHCETRQVLEPVYPQSQG